MVFNKAIASFFGIGYIPVGSGTVAALATVLPWWYFYSPVLNRVEIALSICIIIFFIGVYTSNKMESIWGHDSKKVVIDEVLGMCVSLLFVPHNIWLGIIAFVFFRIFDIWKPFYIRKFENLKAGLGVMSDDLVAGIYTLVVVHGINWALF